jgi:hypothetical protein
MTTRCRNAFSASGMQPTDRHLRVTIASHATANTPDYGVRRLDDVGCPRQRASSPVTPSHIKVCFCQQLLELRVLPLDLPQPLQLGDLQSTEFGTPAVERRVRKPVLPAKLLTGTPASASFRNPTICCSVKRFSSYRVGLSTNRATRLSLDERQDASDWLRNRNSCTGFDSQQWAGFVGIPFALIAGCAPHSRRICSACWGRHQGIALAASDGTAAKPHCGAGEAGVSLGQRSRSAPVRIGISNHVSWLNLI